MIIAISGSWKRYKRDDWKLKQTKKDFERACRDMGLKLAEHGYSVIVGSQSPNTADLHVVEGIMDYVEKHAQDKSFDSPLVHLLRPEDELFPFRRSSERFPQVFSRYAKEEPNWDAAHLSAVERADAVLIVGGAESSYIAGRAAITSGKTLVPVGSFGGAARELLDRVLGKSDIQNKEYYRQLYGPWTDYLLQVTLDLLRVSDYAKASRWVYDLFISFVSDDSQEANQIADEAAKLGLRRFLSAKELKGGDAWEEEIRHALLSSREMCVVITERALESEWVTTEWGIGWALEKRITPILIGLRPSELPDRLRRFQAVKYEQLTQYLEQVQRRASTDIT